MAAALKHHSKVLQELSALYPNAGSELVFSNEYELVCAVVLSAQCTDKKVNEVTLELFGRFPNFKALAKAQIPTVENIIRPVNYYRTKAKHLVELARQVNENFGGALPITHNELISLPGVGNKTANVVMSELGLAPALAVDTHVFRVSQRLGLATGKNVLEIEAALKKAFAPGQWRNVHHTLILHGRRLCKAQRPMCEECALVKLCKFPKS